MKELLACSHVSARPACRPGRGAGMEGPAASSPPCLPQPFSTSAIEHVQGHLVKKQVPPDLFQVCAAPRPSRRPPGAARVQEPGQLPPRLSHQPPASSLSRTLKRFARTFEETCSRNSSRGESGHMREQEGRKGPGWEGCGWRGGEQPACFSSPGRWAPGPVSTPARVLQRGCHLHTPHPQHF